MPGYVQMALTRFNHQQPHKSQHQPYPHMPPKYGRKIQLAQPEEKAPHLDKKLIKFIQEVARTFLFYACIVDSMMLMTPTVIAMEQEKPTTKMLQNMKQFLNYAATNSEAIVMYQASDMVLAVHSDASYLSKPNA